MDTRYACGYGRQVCVFAATRDLPLDAASGGAALSDIPSSARCVCAVFCRTPSIYTPSRHICRRRRHIGAPLHQLTLDGRTAPVTERVASVCRGRPSPTRPALRKATHNANHWTIHALVRYVFG